VSRRPTVRPGALSGAALGALALTGAVAIPATALPVAVGIEPFAGAVALDAHLGDYEWDTSPRAVWGAALRADFTRFGAGARFRSAGTAQRAAWPGEERSLDVSLRSLEGFATVRLASVAGIGLSAGGHAGLLRLGWSPDRLTIDGAGSEPLAVRFDPITEGLAGAGLEARRALLSGFELAVTVDRTWFRLDTAHRRGDEIVEARETFGNWYLTASITRPLLLY
jgi:hypothetical protein